jgi:hypothetical protein
MPRDAVSILQKVRHTRQSFTVISSYFCSC